MPEGHTIHRYARLHRRTFAGEQIAARSPQGRFAEGAARLDGSTLDAVEAYGKHLFYRFTPAGTLHVHLGLFGRFTTYHTDPPPPTDGTRLALSTGGGATLYLAGATVVELIDEARERQILRRLGPDPLRDDADPTRFLAALRTRSVGIGQALLDQRAVAGIGNVYRAELLFLSGIHPDTPANEITAAQAHDIWCRMVQLLHIGEREGRIITVTPADRDGPGAQPSIPGRSLPDRSLTGDVYVYRRAGRLCRRCTATIVSWRLGGRLIFACPRHQMR